MNVLKAKLASVAVVLMLGACASEPPAPIAREEAIELTATVEAIDRQNRLISLRSPQGRTATIHAGPEVRNFDQINQGDQVAVTYYEAIGAAVTKPENATKGVEEDAAVMRAAKGARPAGAIAQSITTTVEIESVDVSMNTVSFRRQDGMTRMLAVEDPEAQKFIRGLKRGDQVTITYMEAVAVAVRPLGRAGG